MDLREPKPANIDYANQTQVRLVVQTKDYQIKALRDALDLANEEKKMICEQFLRAEEIIKGFDPLIPQDLFEIAMVFVQKYPEEDAPAVQRLVSKFIEPVQKALEALKKDGDSHE